MNRTKKEHRRLPILIKARVKCSFSGNQNAKRKNETWKTWKDVCWGSSEYTKY